ncbi:Vacuolar protein sorting-associated protein 22-like protein 1 [Hibiscus syriacus]|uniref:Vacuolar protein sorting-associated protein 22-like protein 1 n=1 Tax=Hibiscus syriacus TaxID=106335 RepID=A0A6A3C9S6_HIBSY|nr:Vacuolar protein sorting-associated protein 22-like protein 1 [Hibiscus syriacus]
MRRRPGIGGLQTAAAARDQYRVLGENVAKLRIDLMKEQLATFRSQLEEFARKHKELCKLLCQKRKHDREAVSEDDCLRAISKLKTLGSGFEVISAGKKKLVRSVPTELNKDHNAILELTQVQGYVTVDEVERRLSWTHGRAIDALDTLLDEGLAMIDDGHRDGRRRYWFPCKLIAGATHDAVVAIIWRHMVCRMLRPGDKYTIILERHHQWREHALGAMRPGMKLLTKHDAISTRGNKSLNNGVIAKNIYRKPCESYATSQCM